MSFQSPAQSSLTTRTGRNLCIRRAVAADEAALEAFFEQVTLEDLRFRFLSAVQHVGHDQIAAMLRTDQQAESVLAFAEDGALRSEEHTSELQSLMRISYAVFCLKKKTSHK